MENTTALALPDEAQLRQDIQAINRFQQIVHKNLIAGLDFGTIPGTQKPTLLKPGAEKIAKLLGLSDQYEILDRQEDWLSGFFRYLVKCRLIHIGHGVTISEGVGECNSMESKYRYRWVFQSELPSHLRGDEGKSERDKLASKTVNTRNGKVKMYKVDNEDIYDQVNTILKMAKKRALVDASLSAGRLSDVFTQDIEDLPDPVRQEPGVETKPNANTKAKLEPEEELFPEEAEQTTALATASQPEPMKETKSIIDLNWLKESLKTLRDKNLAAWSESNLLSYMKATYKVEAETVLECATKLNKGAANHFVKRVQETLEMA